MLFHMNICILASSPGLMAITFPSITAIAPLVAAATKSLWTLKIALSLKRRSGSVLRGSSLVVWSSSFQSRVWPGICSSYPSFDENAVKGYGDYNVGNWIFYFWFSNIKPEELTWSVSNYDQVKVPLLL